MYMSRSHPLADVRKQFSGLIDEVAATHERIVVTRHGEPAAILMAIEDFESLEETVEILADAKLLSDIRRSLKTTRRHSLDQIKNDLKKRSAK
ncbi:MAG: hypothetical protein RL441_81 [Actinomycetota bacterium]|jgi:prevent-host-death family protein